MADNTKVEEIPKSTDNDTSATAKTVTTKEPAKATETPKKPEPAKKSESVKPKSQGTTPKEVVNTSGKPTKTFKAGDVVDLKIGVVLHRTSFDKISAPRYQGPVVIWDDKVEHGRIAITDDISGVRNIAKLLGWVDVDQLIKRSK